MTMFSNPATRKIVLFTLVFAFVVVTTVLAERTAETRSFNVKKGGELVVDVENAGADITVRAWAKDEVLVKVNGIRDEEAKELEIEQSGNTVRVEYYGDHDGWGHSRHLTVIVNVPSEFNLDLATSGGDVDIEDAITGRVTAATSGGDVKIEDVSGTVDLRTSGGDISARNVKGEASLRTAGGDIEVGDVDGRLDAQTAGGDIEIGRVSKDLDARTAGGDIVAQDVGGDVSASTAGGDVQIGRAEGRATLKTAGGDIELKAAKGDITAKTAGGDLDLAGIVGSIDGATAGGDVTVELTPEGGRGSSLETKGGDVTLYINEKAKVTIVAEIRIRGRYEDEEDYEIVSDFEAAEQDSDAKHKYMKIELNGGGPRVKLDTVNGNIEILKLK